jgi:hypothetical protein
MKKTLIVSFLLALFGPNVLARSSSNLAVHVISETQDSARVAKAVSVRIDSTARYTTIVDSKSLLSLDIMCFEIEKIIRYAPGRCEPRQAQALHLQTTGLLKLVVVTAGPPGKVEQKTYRETCDRLRLTHRQKLENRTKNSQKES